MSSHCIGGGGEAGGVSCLFRLIDNSLSRCRSEDVELSRDEERELLISLSKVLREIQGWIDGLACPIKDIEEPVNQGRCVNLQCFTNAVCNLIAFLPVKSKYVQHLVGNVLIAITQFVAKSRSSWAKFVNILCACLEVAFFNALLNSSASLASGNDENLNFHRPDNEVLRLRLVSSTWNTVAEALRIFQRIIKLSKEEQNQGFVQAFICSLSSTFAKVPWELLNGICVHGDGVNKTISFINAGETEQKILFLGNLVQLFCSLVDLDRSEENKPDSQGEYLMVHIVNSLLPEISKWCLDQEEMCHHMHILPYFQHKILVLAMRLASQQQCDCGTLFSWLRLLHSYYKDLLVKPISKVNHGGDDCLQSSPFLWSVCVKDLCYMSSLHVQRQAVFFFLHSWLSLIGQTEPIKSNCACVRIDSASISNKPKVCLGARKGILELYGWLNVQHPVVMLSADEAYMEQCIKFASSFVQLYLHEDDLLVEILLQLFNVITSADKWITKKEVAFDGFELDALCHISNFFNPLLLFHVFLAEIKYDHHLLLDYLISKDLGIKFAEYLLKCLRQVCDSWQEFVDLPVKKAHSSPFPHGTTSQRFSSPCEDPLPTISYGKLDMSKNEHVKSNDSENRSSGTRSLQLMKAKTCLLLLKDSLIKLQKRNLFPYNPEVLLRRFKRFEELCSRHG